MEATMLPEIGTREGKNLLLMGKTGVGKSATGNSILGRPAFTSRGDFTSETVFSKKDVFELDDGRLIRVVDTPGVAETGSTQREGRNRFITAIQEAIALCADGYDALLLTIRFGDRLTKENVDVITFLKALFGNDFLLKHGIIIVTHGDNFKTDPQIEVTFDKWLESQTGYFKKLYEEVNGRVILFDNRGNPEVLVSQRKALVDMVDQLGKRYTNLTFQSVKNEYIKVEKEGAALKQHIVDETSLILARLSETAAKDHCENIINSIDDFENLQERIKLHLALLEGKGGDNQMMLEARRILLESFYLVTQALDTLTDLRNGKTVGKTGFENIREKIESVETKFQDLRDRNNEIWVRRLKLLAKVVLNLLFLVFQMAMMFRR